MLEKIQKFLIENSQINELFLEGKYPTLSPSNRLKNIGMPQEGFYWILLLMQGITMLKGYFKGRKLGKTEKSFTNWSFRTNFAYKTFAKRKILISKFSKSLLIKSLLEIKNILIFMWKKSFTNFDCVLCSLAEILQKKENIVKIAKVSALLKYILSFLLA